MKCSNCNNDVKESWKACPFCGKEIVKELKCKNCGFKLDEKWKICPSCGTTIAEDQIESSIEIEDSEPQSLAENEKEQSDFTYKYDIDDLLDMDWPRQEEVLTGLIKEASENKDKNFLNQIFERRNELKHIGSRKIIELINLIAAENSINDLNTAKKMFLEILNDKDVDTEQKIGIAVTLGDPELFDDIDKGKEILNDLISDCTHWSDLLLLAKTFAEEKMFYDLDKSRELILMAYDGAVSDDNDDAKLQIADFTFENEELSEIGNKIYKDLLENPETSFLSLKYMARTLGEHENLTWCREAAEKAERKLDNTNLCEFDADKYTDLIGVVYNKLDDTEWAKNLIQKSIDYFSENYDLNYHAGDELDEVIENFIDIAYYILEFFEDKDWAKEIYKKAIIYTTDKDQLGEIADAVKEYLEDLRWAKQIKRMEPQFIPKDTFEDTSNPLKFNLALHMVYVEGGTFDMGLIKKHTMYPTLQNKLHQVAVDSFCIGGYPVTAAQFREYCDSENIEFNDFEHENPNSPMTNVAWFQAIKYCNWRSRKDQRTPCYSIDGDTDLKKYDYEYFEENGTICIKCDWEADGYRLPTEAEWEFAARGGNRSKGYAYSGSDNSYQVARFEESNPEGYESVQVNTLKPNELGIHDMSGNVREMCWDFYDEDYFKISPLKNPKGPESGECHVMKGGSCLEEYITIEEREPFVDDNPPYPGFRLVRKPVFNSFSDSFE